MLTFPANFVWGAATSGYQIEGSPEADGKGPSIWDTGRIACNTYDPKQLDADLDLMARLGLKSYIFSVQWPRIQPDGTGPANTKGSRKSFRWQSGGGRPMPGAAPCGK